MPPLKFEAFSSSHSVIHCSISVAFFPCSYFLISITVACAALAGAAPLLCLARWAPPHVVRGLVKGTRVGDDPKGHLHPREPPAAELGTVTVTSRLPLCWLQLSSCLEGPTFFGVFNFNYYQNNNRRWRKRKRIKQWGLLPVFSWSLVFFYSDALLCAVLSLHCYLQQSQFWAWREEVFFETKWWERQ